VKANAQKAGPRPQMMAPPMAPMMLPPAPVPPPSYMMADQQIEQQAAPVVEAAPVTPDIDLPLNVQKKARMAIRDLVRKYRSTPDSEWTEATMQAIGNELSIYHYCQAVSVRYALNEAGAEEALSARVIDLLRENPLVPSDLNLG
jgi:hypothetical protein